jgi:hypothetical protein
MVLEHLLVGEIMRFAWRRHLPRIEMLKSQVDASGYDIVLESGGIMRHIQLKASHANAATLTVPINIELASKPSGCVVWMIFDPDSLEFRHFLWFSGGPGMKIGALDGMRIAKHNKANAKRVKTERPNIRKVPKAKFEKVQTIGGIVHKLFGLLPHDEELVDVTR